jgi:pyruvate formate lyase activating enzyme
MVENGRMYALGYGLVSSEQVDPIEKKPLAQFYPGSQIYSIGGWGCNFSCSFCQNWSISQQVLSDGPCVTPAEVVNRAEQAGGIGIAYTYNEPVIGFEFVRDCAELARENRLKNVMVTNGFINREPAAELLSLIDAINIDIKSIDADFYELQCRGQLQPVLDFACQAVSAGVHVEITTLLIPGLNDSNAQVEALASWIAVNLGRKLPLHLSAYYPCFRMKLPATSPQQVLQACEVASRILESVYPGNIGRL